MSKAGNLALLSSSCHPNRCHQNPWHLRFTAAHAPVGCKPAKARQFTRAPVPSNRAPSPHSPGPDRTGRSILSGRKPKLSPEQWASTRATWEADPRKPLAWLIDEMGMPVGAEALRLRAKAEGWGGAAQACKTQACGGKTQAWKEENQAWKSEAAKPYKPIQTPVKPYKCDVPLAGEVAALQSPPRHDLDGTKLPLRWQVLIEEYLIDFNGTQAAIRAEYSAKSAEQQSRQIMRKPAVRDAIAPWAKCNPAVAAPAKGKVSQAWI